MNEPNRLHEPLTALEFGCRIRTWRHKAGLSQAKCARLCGTSASMWAAMEAGNSGPGKAYLTWLRRSSKSRSEIAHFAEKLNCTFDDLINRFPLARYAFMYREVSEGIYILAQSEALIRQAIQEESGPELPPSPPADP